MDKGVRELSKEQTHDKLVKSATRLFCRQGFHSVSIDEITSDAEVTKGAFYHHFTSKNDVFEKCFVLQAKRIELVLLKAQDSNDRFESALLKAKAFLNFVKHERKNLIPLDEVITVLGWRRWKEIDLSFTMKFIQDSLEKLNEKKLLKDIPVPVIADTIHGLLANLAMVIASRPKEEMILENSIRIFEGHLRSLTKK